MNIEILKNNYLILKKSNDPYSLIWDFKKELLSSDEDDYLDFHYNIIQDPELSPKLSHSIKNFFDKRFNKNKVSFFLYTKYKEIKPSENPQIKADIIQILGHLRSPYAHELALENILNKERDLRYRSIIVLGWVGTDKDLSILNERLLNDNDMEIRQFAATAMRQIWYKHPDTKDKITEYVYNAIQKEENSIALIGMIITIQDLYQKKFGMKESKYGDISGNVIESKSKTIKFLHKIIK